MKPSSSAPRRQRRKVKVTRISKGEPCAFHVLLFSSEVSNCLEQQAMRWLSLQAAVRDGRLNSSELPLAPQAPSSTPSETSPASSTPNDDSASSPGSVQTVGSSQDNTASTGHCSTPGGQSQGVVEWRLVPPSPGGGVLGSGETGYVHAGRQASGEGGPGGQ
jgi:hypothetical protein